MQQLMTVMHLQRDLTVFAPAAVARAVTDQLALLYKIIQKLIHLKFLKYQLTKH